MCTVVASEQSINDGMDLLEKQPAGDLCGQSNDEEERKQRLES
jgi:hypothetical protein